ncbi:hypothetical protein D3C80_1860260 [compost metagenome]
MGNAPPGPFSKVYFTLSPTRKYSSPSAVILGPIRIANLEPNPSSGRTRAKVVDIVSTLTSLIALMVPCPIVLVIGSAIATLLPCRQILTAKEQ